MCSLVFALGDFDSILKDCSKGDRDLAKNLNTSQGQVN